MYTFDFCPKRVIFRSRNAQGLPVYRSGWFLLSSSLSFAQDGFFADWFNMVSETQAEPAPLDHYTQYDDSSSRTGVSV
jgi:hypothetical protein